MSKLGVPNEL
jgi:hypothetical protein